MFALTPAMHRILPLIMLFLLAVVGCSGSVLHAQERQAGAELQSKADSAIDWLLAQLVPNETVPLPAPNRRNLILSYRVPPDHPTYPYLSGRSYIYDDALAVIAFTMTEHYREAESILLALNRLSRKDGSLWFGYNTHNSWPSPEDHEGAIQRTGATAWVGYAVVYYLQARLARNERFLREDPLAARFLEFATRTADALMRRQVLDESDRRHGLITGGVGTYRPTIDPESNTVNEAYDSRPVAWVSSEHNFDAYFFLRDLARITGNPTYDVAATLVRSALPKLWDSRTGQYFRGIRGSQRVDRFLPLDAASWGALYLMAIGDHERARASLAATERYYSTAGPTLKGYTPYFKDPVYENARVNRHFYPGTDEMTWGRLPFVWGEGTLGVAAAHARAGDPTRARQIIRDIEDLSVDGGIRYASREIPFQFSTFPSVASTAWYVISLQLLRNPDDPFWGQ